MRDIGKNIRQLRQNKNMTQDELSERLFVTRQTVSNYETGKSRPDVDMLIKISEVLETDIQHLIYGPELVRLSKETKRLIIGSAVTLALLLAIWISNPIVKEFGDRTFLCGPSLFLNGFLGPVMWLCMGWTLAHLLGMALKKHPLRYPWVTAARYALTALLILWLGTVFLYSIGFSVNDWLFVNHLRGKWEETTYESNGVTYPTKAWCYLPLPIPSWLNSFAGVLLTWAIRYQPVQLLLGAALWLLGFPSGKKV